MRSEVIKAIEKQGLVVRDSSMLDIYEKAYHLSGKTANILIHGESGTGKDCLAKFIHLSGNRAKQPFMHINCNAIPTILFESEMFGYDPGTFTGAIYAGKRGILESANHGTVFLDEIGDVSLANQVKLLQFLQNKTITRLGGSDSLALDVRIICATNKDLKTAVQQGLFREDLYYRIRVVEFVLPPLRERPDDVQGLIELFVNMFAALTGERKTFSEEAMEFIKMQYWQGNVRELLNFVEKVNVLEKDQHITLNMLKGKYNFSSDKEQNTKSLKAPGALTLKEALANYEKQYIAGVIDQTDSLRAAAESLGINLSTLNRKKQQYGLYKQRNP